MKFNIDAIGFIGCL